MDANQGLVAKEVEYKSIESINSLNRGLRTLMLDDISELGKSAYIDERKADFFGRTAFYKLQDYRDEREFRIVMHCLRRTPYLVLDDSLKAICLFGKGSHTISDTTDIVQMAEEQGIEILYVYISNGWLGITTGRECQEKYERISSWFAQKGFS